MPTIRTISPTLPSTTVTQTTLLFTTVTQTTTTSKPFEPKEKFPIAGYVGITIGGLILICGGFSLTVICLQRRGKKAQPLKNETTESIPDDGRQYHLATRRAAQPSSQAAHVDPHDAAKLVSQTHNNFVTVKI